MRNKQYDTITFAFMLKAMMEKSERDIRESRFSELMNRHFAASSIPRGLHCLSLRLTDEYSSNAHARRQLPSPELLPLLFDNSRHHFVLSTDNVLAGARSKEAVDKGWSNWVLLVSKNPENAREFAFREFVNLLKEESEVSEEVLVRDVLYACQGIDGKFVKFDKGADGYVLNELVKVPRATSTMVCRLCELGWLFRKVKSYISESMDKFPSEEVGTVGQAFCAALQDELSEYYKLLAVLECSGQAFCAALQDELSD